MNKKNNTSTAKKEELLTGTSSAVGATIGSMVGNALASEVNAAEVDDEAAPLREHSTKSTATATVTATATTTSTNHDTRSEPRHARNIPNNHDNSDVDAGEVEVIDYQTITYDDGSQVDVAVVNVDGQDMIIADVDMDGKADIIAADLNGNNQLDADEIIDVTGEGISMATFEATVAAGELAQANDYINNADVSDFIA